MSPSIRNCSVPGCVDRTSKRYTIPTHKACKQTWLERIKNPKLSSMVLDLVRKYAVCKSHFNPYCILESGDKLKKFSLPTLNLPDYVRDVDGRDIFLCNSSNTTIAVAPEVLKGSSGRRCFLEEKEELKVLKPTKTYGRRKCGNLMNTSSDLNVVDAGELTVSKPNMLTGLFSFSEDPKGLVERESDQLSIPLMDTKESNVGRNQRVPINKKKFKKMTPRESEMAKELRKMKKIFKKATSKITTQKKQLEALGKTKYFDSLKNINRTTLDFFMSQLRNQKFKPRGRRFTINDKIFALSVYKQSGKGYRYLSKIFSLPSKRSLLKLLSNVSLKCGINAQIFNSLQNTVEKLELLDKYCVLMFDEVSLSPGISYNFSGDFLEGIVDFGGSERRVAFADHALVFMLKGIFKKWKQPVCFYFCENTTPTVDLVRIIKEVVTHVRQTGLDIVATISDQGSTNVAAINKLLGETNEHCLRKQMENKFRGYLVNEQEIVHLYDPPHLIKGIRNAFLTKDIHFCQDGIQKVASWSHIVDVYRLDKILNSYNMLHRLTDEHVIPNKIKKMKVKNATQVFSRSVSLLMNLMSKFSANIRDPSVSPYLDPSASQTADVLLFFDELFDSVNGSFIEAPPTKPLLGVVKATSPHHNFWNQSIEVLTSMKFQHASTKSVITPSLKNFILTLHGFLYISKTRHFDHLIQRSFNQDPLENFFSLIRSHGVRNINPTSSSLISSFKSLLMNNFMASHSPGSNCEEDASCGALETLKKFLLKKIEIPETPTNVKPPVYPTEEYKTCESNADLDLANSYVAGYLAKKILKDTNKCSNCLEIMEAYDEVPSNALIKARTFKNCKMFNPSRTFNTIFHNFTKSVIGNIPLFFNSWNIKRKIMERVNTEEVKMLFCNKHKDVHRKFINVGIKFILLFYIGEINKILCGKTGVEIPSDPIVKMALVKYDKRRWNR